VTPLKLIFDSEAMLRTGNWVYQILKFRKLICIKYRDIGVALVHSLLLAHENSNKGKRKKKERKYWCHGCDYYESGVIIYASCPNLFNTSPTNCRHPIYLYGAFERGFLRFVIGTKWNGTLGPVRNNNRRMVLIQSGYRPRNHEFLRPSSLCHAFPNLVLPINSKNRSSKHIIWNSHSKLSSRVFVVNLFDSPGVGKTLSAAANL
jgi:hypothetical protein